MTTLRFTSTTASTGLRRSPALGHLTPVTPVPPTSPADSDASRAAVGIGSSTGCAASRTSRTHEEVLNRESRRDDRYAHVEVHIGCLHNTFVGLPVVPVVGGREATPDDEGL